MPGTSCYLSRLLFAEVCLLAAISGILAWRFPGPGLFLFAVLALLDVPRPGAAGPWARSVLLVFCFIAAFGYAAFREPSPPPVPAWLEQAAAASVNPHAAGTGGKKKGFGAEPLPVLARVDSCTPLPGGRLRVVLDGIGLDPAYRGEVAGGSEFPYQGKAVWTWNRYNALEYKLLPGQNLELKLRFAPLRGFANPGGWDPKTYWHDRGVYFRAWGGRDEKPFSWSGDMWRRRERPGNPAQKLVAIRDFAAEKRWELQRDFLAALPEQSGASAILPALVFGDRSLLSQEQVDFFARSTLAHSLALSGLHLGFAVLAGYLLARAVGYVRPALWQRISRPKLALLLALPVAGLYLWLGQAPISLLRAACMLGFWTLLVFLRRPRVLLDGLFAALACILLASPFALYELSLQLSALSIAAIALCLPFVMRLADRLFPKSFDRKATGRLTIWKRSLLHSTVVIMGVSLCIQVALLPITVNAFGTSGLLFPLNIIWLPVLGALVLPLAFLGLLAVSLGLQSLAGLLLFLADLPCEALLALLRLLDQWGLLLSPLLPRPHWLVWAGFWLFCLALPGLAVALCRHRNKQEERPSGAGGRRAVCLAAAGAVCVLLPIGADYLESGRTGVNLKLLDVGQGQAVLVEWSGLGPDRVQGRALVDGGGFASDTFDVGKAVLAPLLTDMALPRLDAVINTHPDTDHLGGLLFILDGFRVGRYMSNGDTPAPVLYARERAVVSRRGLKREQLIQGDTVPWRRG